MPLNLPELQAEIEIALKEVFRFDSLAPGQEKDDTEKIYEDLAERLASAIDTFVRSGTVKSISDIGTVGVPSGSPLAVSSTGIVT